MKAYFNRNRRILLVGEASAISKELVTKLRDLGMDCLVASNAVEALETLEKMSGLPGLPGLIVCDSKLPDSSGPEFVTRLRRDARFETIPVIVATGNIQHIPGSNSRNDYLHAKSEGLVESISGVLAMHGGLDENRSHGHKGPELKTGNVDIVVAEDNDINQFVLSQFLETTPWTFLMVGNGRRAVHAYRNCQPKLILMDISMPEMNGREATAVIRAIEQTSSKRIPIIALTAHALKGDREACLASGMDDYMAKPINFAELRALIESYLGRPIADRSAA